MRKVPFIILAIALISGVILGIYLHKYLIICLILLFIVLILSIVFHKNELTGNTLIILSVILLGFVSSVKRAYFIKDDDVYNYISGEIYEVDGVITSDVVEKNGSLSFVIKPDSIILNGENVDVGGKVRVRVYDAPQDEYRYGTVINGEMRLVKPEPERFPDGFDYRKWLITRGIRTLGYANDENIHISGQTAGNPILNSAYELRSYLNDNMKKIMPGNAGSIIRGITLGVREEIPENIEREFNISGVTHILAISGQNLSLITFVLFLFVTSIGVSRRIGSLICIPFVIFYSILTGFDPPIVRAMIMAMVVLMGIVIKREVNLLNSIGFSAFVFVLFNPLIIYDVGFQLSFAAVISIALFYQPVFNFIRILPPIIRETFSATASAQIGVIPILLYHFYGFSVVGLVANLIIVPLSSILMAISFIGTLFIVSNQNIAVIVLKASSLLSWLIIKLTHLFSLIPHAKIYPGKPTLLHIVLYCLSLLIFYYLIKSTHKNKVIRFSVLLLVMMNIFIYSEILKFDEDKNLRITVLDVGDADSIVIETPDDNVHIVDGGKVSKFWDTGETTLAPYLRSKGYKQIKSVINTHPHYDHLGGLIYIVDNFKVDRYYDIGVPYDTWTYQEMMLHLRDSDVEYHKTYPGRILSANKPGIYFLSPEYYYKGDINLNDISGRVLNHLSSVIYIEYGEFIALLASDRQQLQYSYHNIVGERLSFLKVPHQGSFYKGQEEYVSLLEPSVAVITCGYNPYIYDEETRVNYEDVGSLTLLTREVGSVVIETDGEEMVVRTMY